MQATPKTSTRNWKARARSILHIASEVADLAVHVKTRPGPLTWVSLAVKFADVGVRIHDELREGSHLHPNQFFGMYDENPAWHQLPKFTHKIIYENADQQQRVTVDAPHTSHCAWTGVIGDFKVGWIAKKDTNEIESAFVSTGTAEGFMDWFRDVCWKHVGGNSAVVTPGEILPEDLPDAGSVIETGFVHDLAARTMKFYEAGVTRSYLVVGPPGTGKTTAVRRIANATGARTLRVPLKALEEGDTYDPSVDIDAGAQIDILIRILQPDILLIDDIDRAPFPMQSELLEFTESIRKNVKVFMATANDLRSLIDPLRRPERFDDLIDVPTLSLEEVQLVLGDQADAAPLLLGCPIVYLFDYLQRVKILGPETAREEIPTLLARLNAVPKLDND